MRDRVWGDGDRRWSGGLAPCPPAGVVHEK
jgi:hypothetical protein